MSACITVDKGQIGEAGSSLSLDTIVKGETSKMVVLRNAGGNLCPSNGTIASLLVNNQPVGVTVFKNDKGSLQAEANPGDRVIAVAHLIDLRNGIQCITLGNMSLQLDECDLVT